MDGKENLTAMKLWRISGIDRKEPYEIHADTKNEAIVNFINNELGLVLSNFQFTDAVQRLGEGKFCMLNSMLLVEEVLE